jgi:hypothetical protein
MKTVSAVSALLISGLVVVEAKECRETAKQVIHSTVSDSQNETDGGHVSRHVVGYPTEKDNTQFMKWADFTTAFAGLRKAKIKNAANCPADGSGTRIDCIDAKTAGVTDAQKCKATDSKQGCAKTPKPTSFTPKIVVFRYLNNASTKNEWIVHTAYPSEDSTCPDS